MDGPTAVAAFWLNHLERTDTDVRDDFNRLRNAATPASLASAMRVMVEGPASPIKPEVAEQIDFGAIAADQWEQGNGTIKTGGHVARLMGQRSQRARG